MKNLVNSQGLALSHLRRIINQLADDGVHIGEESLSEVAHARFREVQRVLPLPMARGEHLWPVADPSLLVPAQVRSSAALQEIFASALQRHPGTPEAPWHLLFTWDEFTLAACSSP